MAWASNPKIRYKNIQVQCLLTGKLHEYRTLCQHKGTLRILASCPHIWIPSIFQEVIVLYEGEKAEDTFDPSKNQIVEMPKERPAFFSKNLLQKANPHSSRGSSGDNVRPP